MTLFVVNKSGNDSNDGLATTTAKLSIGGALAAAGNGDTITVQSGVYFEGLLVNPADLIIQADGYVEMDGLGLITRAFQFAGGASRSVIGFRIHGYVIGIEPNNTTIRNCIIWDCAGGIDRVGSLQRFGAPGFTLLQSLIYNCNSGMRPGGPTTISQSTIVDCTVGILIDQQSNPNTNISNTIIAFCDQLVSIRIGSPSGAWGNPTADFNNLHFIKRDGSTPATAFFKGTTANNLVEWRTAAGKDANSISLDPLFVDRLKDLFRLNQFSPSHTAGTGIPATFQGAFGEFVPRHARPVAMDVTNGPDASYG